MHLSIINFQNGNMLKFEKFKLCIFSASSRDRERDQQRARADRGLSKEQKRSKNIDLDEWNKPPTKEAKVPGFDSLKVSRRPKGIHCSSLVSGKFGSKRFNELTKSSTKEAKVPSFDMSFIQYCRVEVINKFENV